jgi:hypothetical protein
MTVKELLRRVDSRELSEWMELYRIEAREHAEAQRKRRGQGRR